MSEEKMTPQAAVAYLQPIADSAIVGGYAEALGTVMRTAQASLPDRTAIVQAVRSVKIGPFGPNTLAIIEKGGMTHLTPNEAERVADAVLAALSTQPAAGEVEWEYGHDCDDSREICGDDGGPHHEWEPNPECVNVTLYRRRPAGAWEKTQPEPAPELAELFPGTLAALDRLSIRPEADRG